MARIGWGRILAGVAATAAAGAAYVYFRQRTARAPLHEVLHAEGGLEIRRYPPLLVIETRQNGSRDRALGNGFAVLAAYMFGEGREGDELPITMPVLMAPDGPAWRVRFLLPQGQDEQLLEEPGPGMAIVTIPAREMAAIRIPGQPTDRSLAAGTADLARWIADRGRLAAGAAEQAYYNSPLRPGTSHANEVLIPLAGASELS